MAPFVEFLAFKPPPLFFILGVFMPFIKNSVDVRIFRYGQMPQLTKDLIYRYPDSSGYMEFIIPKGFETDFASIPRIFWNIIAPIGKHTLPSILHDYLYTEGYKLNISRKKADKIFYDAMIESHVARITANIMWFCVRCFAFKHYKKGD